MEAKIFFISDTNGETTIVYCLTLTEDEIKKMCEHCGIKIVDIAEIRQDDIQYYCIDGRVWWDTPEKESAVRKVIALMILTSKGGEFFLLTL